MELTFLSLPTVLTLSIELPSTILPVCSLYF